MKHDKEMYYITSKIFRYTYKPKKKGQIVNYLCVDCCSEKLLKNNSSYKQGLRHEKSAARCDKCGKINIEKLSELTGLNYGFIASMMYLNKKDVQTFENIVISKTHIGESNLRYIVSKLPMNVSRFREE